MNLTTTWRQLITDAMKRQDETFKDVVACTLNDKELDVKFDNDYGSPEGKPFTLWTHKRVYFPCEYDGAEWVGSASRDPDNKPTRHM